MNGLLKSVSGWTTGYRVFDLPQPWYRLAQLGRKRILCVPDGPGSSVLVFRNIVIIRLRGQGQERFEARVTGISQHASIRALLHNEGVDVLPDLLTGAPGERLEQAIEVQQELFSDSELALIAEWGVRAVRIVPTDLPALDDEARALAEARRRRSKTVWYTRLWDEE